MSLFTRLSAPWMLAAIYRQNRKTQQMIGNLMSTTDDLNSAVTLVVTATTDAASALKDLAAKLGSASSVNPADVESAAAKLTQIAAGLESVVQSVGEPVTQAPAPVEPAPPAPGSDTTAGTETNTVTGGQGSDAVETPSATTAPTA